MRARTVIFCSVIILFASAPLYAQESILVGHIDGIDSKKAVIDAGEKQGIAEGIILTLQRGDTLIGKVKVVRVFENTSHIVPAENLTLDDLEPYDLVHTGKGVYHPDVKEDSTEASQTNIVGITDKAVTLELDGKNNVKEGMILSVSREGKTIGTLKVIRISKNTCEAVILTKNLSLDFDDVVSLSETLPEKQTTLAQTDIPMGTIVGISPKDVTLDAGQKEGLQEGAVLTVERENETVGRIKITQVLDNTSKAVPVEGDTSTFQLDDRVPLEKTALSDAQTQEPPSLISGITDKTIEIARGKDDGYAENMELSIQRSGVEIAKARIVSASSNKSTAVVTKLIPGADIEFSDIPVPVTFPPQIAFSGIEKTEAKEKQTTEETKEEMSPLERQIASIKNVAKKTAFDLSIQQTKVATAKPKPKEQPPMSDFPIISAAIKGKTLTSYSYSGKGVDLKEAIGFDLKLLAQSKELDAEKIGRSDEGMSNIFLSDLSSDYEKYKYSALRNYVKNPPPKTYYNLIGFSMNLTESEYAFSVLNYMKPQKKKKRLLFGGNTKGPYFVNVTQLLPNTEKVSVGGSTLNRGTDYTLDLAKGELNFTNPVSFGTDILIEYDVAENSGNQPGKFLGLRFAKEKPQNTTQNSQQNETSNTGFEISSFGFSFFQDQVVNNTAQGNQLVAHSLIGIDAEVQLNKDHSFSFELARSLGDKKKELGDYAFKRFTIADTKSSTKDPKGPYYLDTDKLPLLENTVDMRVDNVLLQKDTDYYIDAQDGRLVIRKKDINLTDLSIIEVRYRYLPASALTAPDAQVKGLAGIFSLKDKFNKLTHELSYKRYSGNFQQIGGVSSTMLSDLQDSLNFSSDAFSLSAAYGTQKSLEDRNTGLILQSKNMSLSSNMKLLKKWAFGLDYSKQTQQDNKAVKDTDSANQNLSYQIEGSPMKNAKLTLRHNETKSSNKGGALNMEQENTDNAAILSLQPVKILSLQTSFTEGEQKMLQNNLLTKNKKTAQGYKVRIVPNKTLSLDMGYDKTIFKNEKFQNQSTQNQTYRLMYFPSEKFSFNVNLRFKEDLFLGQKEKQNTEQYMTAFSPNKALSFQESFGTMKSKRATSDLSTTQNTLNVTYTKPELKNLSLSGSHSFQTSKSVIFSKSSNFEYETTSTTIGVGVTANPIWKAHQAGIILTQTTTKDKTNPSQDSKEHSMKYMFGFPFVAKTSFKTEYTLTKRSGGQHVTQKDFKLTLSGNLIKGVTVSGAYSLMDYRYIENPYANRKTSLLTFLISGNIKF